MLHLITDPRSFIYNRLSPMLARPAVEGLTGRDQYGRKVSLGETAETTALGATPIAIQAGAKEAVHALRGEERGTGPGVLEGVVKSFLQNFGIQYGKEDSKAMDMLKKARQEEAVPLSPEEQLRVRFMNDVRSRMRRADQFQKTGDDASYQSEIKAANAALATGYNRKIISDKDAERINGDWQEDPRVHSFDGLRDWHSAVKVFAAGTPDEQKLWKDSLEKKINAEIAKDPRRIDDIIAEVQQRFGSSATLVTNRKE